MAKKDPFATFPELRNSALFSMANAFGVVWDRLTEIDAKHGVTIRQVWLLVIAEHHTASQGVIAECLGINKNSMVELIDTSVEQGIVQRVTNPHNRRENLIKITPKGREIIRSIWRSQGEMIAEAFWPISAKDVRKIWDWCIEVIQAEHKQKK